MTRDREEADFNFQKENTMERDVVCNMQVDPNKAAATTEYNGKTYYFCAIGCKKKFDANPTQYVK
jgi:Cu+-exporting ATPase